MEKNGVRLSCIFVIFAMIFSLVIIKIGYNVWRIAELRSSWKKTEGVVIRKSKKGWWDEKEGRWYHLKYAYTVSGKEYASVRYHIEEENLKTFYGLEAYRKGDPIPVYYNPDRPKESVLNADYLRNHFLFISPILGLIAMALCMVSREARWKRIIEAVSSRFSEGYDGSRPLTLPGESMVLDTGALLKLDTSMSIFWYLGMPSAVTGFLGMAYMGFFLQPINPGWTLKNYVAVLFVLMGVALMMSAVTRRFKHFLEIDRAAQEVREIHRGLFGEKIKSIPFGSVEGSKVSQEAWHHTHTLKGWTLHLKIKNQRPLFIAYRTRDLQPQDRGYLEVLRNRMDYLIFGYPS